MKQEFKYFSSVEGHVAARWGSASSIGARRIKGGWEWNTEKIVPVPLAEYNRYIKEYINSVRTGALLERTEEEYKEYIAKLKAAADSPKDKEVAAPEADGDEDSNGVTNKRKTKKNKKQIKEEDK